MRGRKPALITVVIAAILGVAVGSATATAPGKSGRIAFRRYLDVQKTTSAIFSANPDGKRVRQVTRPGAGVDDRRPDWSPRGAKIAFERKVPCPAGGAKDGLTNTCDSVYTIKETGKGLKRLVSCRFKVRDATGTPDSDCVGVDDPAWSPNGAQIAFQYNLADKTYSGSLNVSAGIWIVNANGTGLHQVTQRAPGTSWDFGAGWSPDGRRLAFVRADLQREADAIFTVNVDGSGLTQVTPWELNGGDRVDWSPDGRWILFRVDGSDGASNLYTVHPDGTGLTNLTKQGAGGYHYLSASFSPSGTKIVTARTPGAGSERAADVVVMKSNGSKVGSVTKTRLWESAADWGAAPLR
jgi:Tol biopolymer transport system component